MSEENNVTTNNVDTNTENSTTNVNNSAEVSNNNSTSNKNIVNESVINSSVGGSNEKVFTQQEVNNLIARENKKYAEKVLKDMGIGEFDNIKDGVSKAISNQTQQNEAIASLAAEMEKLKNDKLISDLKIETSEIASNNGLDFNCFDKETQKFIIDTAKQMINDETTSTVAIEKTLGILKNISNTVNPIVEKTVEEESSNNDEASNVEIPPPMYSGADSSNNNNKNTDEQAKLNAFIQALSR